MFIHSARLAAAIVLAVTLFFNIGQAKAGVAVQPDGNGDFIIIPDSPSLSPTTQLTLEAWVRISSYQGRTVIGKHQGDSGPDGRSYILSITSTGQVSAFISHTGSTAGPQATSSGSIALGRWQHVAATFDGATLRVYRNGVEEGSASSSGGIYDSILPVHIGFFTTSNPTFNGDLDEVRIWSVARSQPEIQTAMHQVLTGTETGLGGYWQFDAQDITDTTPNGNNGSVSGNPTWIEPGFETIAYWNFNDGAGTTATDISGNGHDATLHGAQWISGIDGSGVEVSATLQTYLTAAASSDFGFSPSQSFTIEGWAKASPTYTGDVYGLIVGHENNQSSTWGLNSKGGLSHNFRLNGYGRVGEVRSRASNHSDQWGHVAVVYDATTGLLRMYSNGQLSQLTADLNLAGQIVGGNAIQVPANAPLGTSGDLHFGKAEPLSNHYLTGVIDEVRLSRVALSPSEFLFPVVNVSMADTVAPYDTGLTVPVDVGYVRNKGIVAAELQVAYDSNVATPATPDATSLSGTLVELGWSIEENVLPGISGIDTLVIAMSTAQDTLSDAGTLINLEFQTADIRQPDSTAIQLVHVLFNDGSPAAITTDGKLKLTGTDGVIDAQPDSIYPRNTIDITITDIDLDLDVDTPDQVTVTATGSDYADVEPVSLMETGNSTGIFTGSIPTAFSASAVASGDGTIATIAGDSIIVSYTDVLSAAGNTETRTDKVSVIGGVDAQLAASYVVQALDGRNNLRDIVRLRVTDLDPDLDVGLAEQVSVTTTNNAISETEVISLPETDLATGIFQDSLLTQAGASGTDNDGTVVLPTVESALDSLTTVYIDTLNAAGGYDTLSATTYVINLFGDVSADDRVGAFDAAQVLATAAGRRSMDFREQLAGDVDGSGEILAIDASHILQYVVRIIDDFPVQTDTDIALPDDPKNHPFLKPVAPEQLIALGDLQIQPDGAYLLPIHLVEREGILSGTLTLATDPGIELLDITTGDGYAKFMTAHNNTDEGITLAFAGSQSKLTGSGDVLYLKLRSTTDLPICLSLDRVYLNGLLLTPAASYEVLEATEPLAEPLITQLYQNVPNPFNPQTTIRYDLSEAGRVNVVIYSITGQRIRTLVAAHQDAGSYQITWDGKDAFGQNVGSSVYLVRLTTETFTQARKIVLLR